MIKQLIFILSFLAFLGCANEKATPKPESYPRVQFPEKSYKTYTGDCPFSFEIPKYSEVKPGKDTAYCWLDIEYKPFDATLYLSYKSVDSIEDFRSLTEDSRELVYKHTVKAEEIRENVIRTDKGSVGMLYELEGNTATALQFYITDSLNHYLRGSLYFDAKPNRDSLDPMINYLTEDILKLIKSTEWDKPNS